MNANYRMASLQNTVLSTKKVWPFNLYNLRYMFIHNVISSIVLGLIMQLHAIEINLQSEGRFRSSAILTK